jgi:very-short-patch-repair endonuclease
MLSRGQNQYLDVAIKQKAVRDCISGENEKDFLAMLTDGLGLIEDKDFKHQYAFHDSETIIVVDFFFPSIGLAVELDGGTHRNKIQRKLDKRRDMVVRSNGFDPIRIRTPLSMDRLSYWMSFLNELLRSRDSA